MEGKGGFLWRPRYDLRHPPSAEARCPHLLETWLRHFPASTPDKLPSIIQFEYADFEDWVENVIRLYEAEKTGIPVTILKRWKGRSDNANPYLEDTGPDAPLYVHLGEYDPADGLLGLPDEMPARFIGPAARGSWAVSDYHRSTTFLRAATRHRQIYPAGCGKTERINDVLRMFYVGEFKEVFIKTVVKERSEILVLPTDPQAYDSIANLAAALEGEDGDSLIGYGDLDRENLWIVQSIIEPQYEYRFIIVDGKVVTGAGAVEEFTPLNNTAQYDPRMRKRRPHIHPGKPDWYGDPIGDPDPVEDCSDLLRKYLRFARDFAWDYAEEVGPRACYSLDMCLDNKSGAVTPIELNPMVNLGLYACDAAALIAALASMLNFIRAS